jgi:hypothetical protein
VSSSDGTHVLPGVICDFPKCVISTGDEKKSIFLCSKHAIPPTISSPCAW